MFFRRSFPLGVGTLHDMLAQWYRCVWDDWACSTAAVRTHAATAGGRRGSPGGAAAGTHAALPTCHRHIGIVPNGTTGLFEPLPYPFHKKERHPKGVLLFYGAGDEARTRYLDLGKVALYQMSYARKMVPPVGVEPTTRGFSVRCSTN